MNNRLGTQQDIEEPLRQPQDNPRASMAHVKREKPSYLTILLTKNFLLMLKNPKNLIFLVITPFILSLFLWSFQKLSV